MDPFSVLFPVILISLLGFLLSRYRKLDLKTLADYIIYIASPSLALTQFSIKRFSLNQILSIGLSALFVILGSGLIAFLLFRLFKKDVPSGLYLPIMSMNSGYIGFPLVLMVFHQHGLHHALVFNLVNAFLVFTLGLYIVSRGKDRWAFLKIPFIYASIIGLLLSYFGLKLPPTALRAVSLLGSTAIPLALFLLGAKLAQLKISSWKLPVVAAFLRVSLGLLLGFAAVYLFRLDGIIAKIVILLSSLSSGVTAVALAEEYDNASDLVASTVAISILFSIPTTLIILKFFI